VGMALGGLCDRRGSWKAFAIGEVSGKVFAIDEVLGRLWKDRKKKAKYANLVSSDRRAHNLLM